MAAGTTAGLLGLTSKETSAATERRGIPFNRVVDMVKDAGCDPTGSAPCDEALRATAADNTLLKFPAGTYKLTEQNVVLGKTNLGFLGEGDVQFTVPAGFNEKALVVDNGTGLLFENIDVDLTADGATPGLHFGADSDLEVHDVEFVGQGIHPDSDPRGGGNGNPDVTNAFTPIVRSPDGTGHISNVVARNDGLMGAYNGGDGRVGVWIGITTQGTITLENCRFEGFPNNGLYCSRTNGVVRVEGGEFSNNDISQVRIGSKGSYIDGGTLSVDAGASASPNPGDMLNGRGVRLEVGSLDTAGPEVRNCDITIGEVSHSGGGVVASGDIGSFTALDTRINIAPAGVRGVLAKDPTDGSYTTEPPYDGTLRNISVTGAASDTAAIELRKRPESVVDGCCVQTDGDGVEIVDSDGSVVRNTTLNVAGEAIVTENAAIDTAAITNSGQCPMPNDAAASAGSFENTLTIEAAPGADYEFAVSGKLESNASYGATDDPNDELAGSSASGQVGDGGRDSYTYSGTITKLLLRGGANIYHDGAPVDPTEYLSNTVTIESQSSAEYEITTSDGIVKSEAMGAADPNDNIGGRTAIGQVGEGGRDSYAYPGEITDIKLEGDGTIYRNGEEIDPSEFGVGNTLTIEGAPGADYKLAVNESLKKTTANNATADPNDSVSGQRATGQVGGGGRDSYVFASEITRLVLNGGANLYYGGKSIDPAEYLPNTVTIESQSSAEYEITTSDGIVKSEAIGAADPNDGITGRTATGQVGEGGRDSYAYPGKITNLSADGDATIYRNGTEIGSKELGKADVLTIEGAPGADYELTVTDSLEKSTMYDATADSNDSVEGTSTTGQVGGGGRDSYAITGSISRLLLRGGAILYYNGEPIDPAEYLPNTVTVESQSNAEYAITTSDGIVKSKMIGSADPTDSIDGTAATGRVGEGGRDSYAYPGEITNMDIEGDATVYRNETVLDNPESL
jgi:hypothetical protein